MARRAKEPDFGADQRELQITEALERRRKQLDQEIAEFKAEKEHDYRLFERKLRDKSTEDRVRDAPRNQRKHGPSKEKEDDAESCSMQQEKADHEQRESHEEEITYKAPHAETENSFIALRSKFSPAGPPGPPGRLPEAVHERKYDFEGVFTPSYLPLVQDAPVHPGSGCKDHLQASYFSPEDLSAPRHNSSAMLSSSAEIVHPPMTSPPLPPARPLSSSVPPEESSHHRSDSSRSDNSIASLRSSLRDPKQPRSPKRVLFSIDDTLVSPSTSPVAHRSKSSIPSKPADSIDTTGGFEKFEVVPKQNGKDATVNRSQSNGAGSSPPSAQANSWTASLLNFGHGQESNSSKTSSSAGRVDDFEHLENEDLFTFDEDMGSISKGKPRETRLEEEYDEDVEIDEKQGKDPLTASSPHAGSLPIEIKWPGRREDRG